MATELVTNFPAFFPVARDTGLWTIGSSEGWQAEDIVSLSEAQARELAGVLGAIMGLDTSDKMDTDFKFWIVGQILEAHRS